MATACDVDNDNDDKATAEPLLCLFLNKRKI